MHTKGKMRNRNERTEKENAARTRWSFSSEPASREDPRMYLRRTLGIASNTSTIMGKTVLITSFGKCLMFPSKHSVFGNLRNPQNH